MLGTKGSRDGETTPSSQALLPDPGGSGHTGGQGTSAPVGASSARARARPDDLGCRAGRGPARGSHISFSGKGGEAFCPLFPQTV